MSDLPESVDESDDFHVPDHLEFTPEPRVLECSESPYEVERTAAMISNLAEMRGWPLPHGWRLDPSVDIDPTWHQGIVNWMADERRDHEPHHLTYARRLAILVFSVWSAAHIWTDVDVRKGTAWVLLRNGLARHHFVTDSTNVRWVDIVAPSADFFERCVTDVERLAKCIRAGFIHDPSRGFRFAID